MPIIPCCPGPGPGTLLAVLIPLWPSGGEDAVLALPRRRMAATGVPAGEVRTIPVNIPDASAACSAARWDWLWFTYCGGMPEG